jgi:hypothetical protein
MVFFAALVARYDDGVCYAGEYGERRWNHAVASDGDDICRNDDSFADDCWGRVVAELGNGWDAVYVGGASSAV